jgi:hypothetical protein
MDLDVYTFKTILTLEYFGADPLTSGQILYDQCHCQIKQPITDATLRINDIALLCNSRKITIDYSYNTNSTAIVPAATPIAIYANGLD